MRRLSRSIPLAAIAPVCAVCLAVTDAAGQCSADKLPYPGQQDSSPWFGSAVATSGEFALVGAPSHIEGGVPTGGAFVFRRNGPPDWSFDQKLVSADGQAFDSFGNSVAVWETVAIVGASGAGGTATDSGAAYVFRFDGLAWTHEQRLVASDGAPFDGFGGAAVFGDLAVVGAPGSDPHGSSSGAAYVFRFDGLAWIEEQKLAPGAPGEDLYFGRALATDGQRVVVSAMGYEGFAGAVYVFEVRGGEWEQTHLILSPDHAPGAVFGNALALDGDRLLVGAPGESSGGVEQAGAAYVFAYDQSTGEWTPEAKLSPSGRQELDNYGVSVALWSGVALVGKNPHDPTMRAEPAMFRWRGEWSQRGELDSAFDSSGAIYGGAVAAAEGVAIVGSRPDWDGDTLPGAAFAFNLRACLCGGDFNGDGSHNTIDVIAFLNAWTARHPGADYYPDGVIDTRDFIAFLNFWNAGC